MGLFEIASFPMVVIHQNVCYCVTIHNALHTWYVREQREIEKHDRFIAPIILFGNHFFAPWQLVLLFVSSDPLSKAYNIAIAFISMLDHNHREQAAKLSNGCFYPGDRGTIKRLAFLDHILVTTGMANEKT